jgi:hypothetical protein
MQETFDYSMYSVNELEGFLRTLHNRQIVAMHFGRMPSERLLAQQAAAEAELARRGVLSVATV